MARLRTLGARVQTLGARLPSIVPGSWRTDKQGSTARGYTYRWQQESKAFLRTHPLCQCPDCDDGRKRVTVATVVDHRIPHRGDIDRFWDQSNWQSMAEACQDAKTQRE